MNGRDRDKSREGTMVKAERAKRRESKWMVLVKFFGDDNPTLISQ